MENGKAPRKAFRMTPEMQEKQKEKRLEQSRKNGSEIEDLRKLGEPFSTLANWSKEEYSYNKDYASIVLLYP